MQHLHHKLADLPRKYARLQALSREKCDLSLARVSCERSVQRQIIILGCDSSNKICLFLIYLRVLFRSHAVGWRDLTATGGSATRSDLSWNMCCIINFNELTTLKIVSSREINELVYTDSHSKPRRAGNFA